MCSSTLQVPETGRDSHGLTAAARLWMTPPRRDWQPAVVLRCSAVSRLLRSRKAPLASGAGAARQPSAATHGRASALSASCRTSSTRPPCAKISEISTKDPTDGRLHPPVRPPCARGSGSFWRRRRLPRRSPRQRRGGHHRRRRRPPSASRPSSATGWFSSNLPRRRPCTGSPPSAPRASRSL